LAAVKPNPDTYFSKSLEKGLRILALFNDQTRSMTQSEISAALGMNMTSTYRYVSTLIRLGYLGRDPHSKKLAPGLQSMVLSLNMLRSGDAHQAIKTLVDRVHVAHGITIDVALAVDGSMITLYRREAEETLVYRLPIVSRAWHTTALGKAYLSHLPEKERLAAVKKIKLTPKTPNTIVNRDRFLSELKSAQKAGYSSANEEYMPGLIAIGAPVFNLYTDEVKGAVSFDFSIIQCSLEEVEEKYATVLKELARSVSEAITST
jgi:DNA-binding IclR family transcriptional regulator